MFKSGIELLSSLRRGPNVPPTTASRGAVPAPGWLAIMVATLITATMFSTPSFASLTFYTDQATFQAAAPGLTTETFESTKSLVPDNFLVCSHVYSFATADACWSPGDITAGLTIGSSIGGGATVILGPAYYGTASIVTGANDFEAATELGFPAGTPAAGMDLVAAVEEDFTISIYGADDVLLGSTTAPGNVAGKFFGVKSTQAITRIELTSTDDTLVDNVSFQAADPGTLADLALDLLGTQGPPGTMTYTLTVTNHGPGTASGIDTLMAIPAGLAYVSNDCGGSNATPPWHWHVATLANGASSLCHIVATIVDASNVVISASVQSTGSLDLAQENNYATTVADLAIAITAGPENPAGSMAFTVTVINDGPSTATNVAVGVAIPAAVTYASDDCGGASAGLPYNWAWNISKLSAGNNVVCHVFVSMVSPQGFVVSAKIKSSDQVDFNSSNDTAGVYAELLGPGPGTPETGLTLFRSFADLAFTDETGASFSLRNNAGKVMLLQFCAVWCGPCNHWTSLSPQLAASVDQKIGAGHFLDVDMLTQSPVSTPSTQANAQAWKTQYSFPGPVLHAEGSTASPLWTLDLDRASQYAAIQSQAFFPEFFILAPDCNNQIAVRVSPDTIGILGEQRGLQEYEDAPRIEEMANLIADVWNNRPCAKPVLHRLDRCSVGSTQIFSNPQTGDFAEAAEPFNVPAGKKYVVSSVTAVTDASILDFTVYADASGVPGSAVCTSTGRPAAAVYAPGVKKIKLDAACTLPSGNYWMALKGHSDVDATFVPTWKGGALPPSGAYFYRDSAGCTAWNAAGQCLAGQQNAQLCYMLETDVLFSAGFEASVP